MLTDGTDPTKNIIATKSNRKTGIAGTMLGKNILINGSDIAIIKKIVEIKNSVPMITFQTNFFSSKY